MLPIQVPAQIQATPVQTIPLAVALAQLLDEYDLKGDGHPLTPASVPTADQPALRWLHAALTRDIPDNPFPPGSRSYSEAEGLRALLKGGGKGIEAGLASLELREAGTQMGLWRWGRRLGRAGRLGPAIRLAWEAALLSVPGPALATSYALRHALSFALAEGDLARFTNLKADHATNDPEVILGFQRLFGLIGTPGPRFHLRQLPALQPVEKGLQDLGGESVWICPADPAKPTSLPAGTAWIIPPGGEGDESNLQEAATSSSQNPAAGSRIWFAPERDVFEAYGIVLFPVLVSLDFRGCITSIHMGEAAPQTPLFSPAQPPAAGR
jgi:hypothetical protein